MESAATAESMTVSYRLAFIFLLGATCWSLRAQQNRITGPIDSARTATLSGNLRPARMRQSDQGRVAADFALPAMTLLLKPTAIQHADLVQLLEQQQNPASPLYHRWLTPEEYADRFCVSADDIATMSEWLQSQGFTVSRAARGRTWIAFSGTARQVETSFHTEIHQYLVGGIRHFANATEPSIPAAF